MPPETPLPSLRLRPCHPDEMPLLHLLATREPFFFHTDGRLIDFQEFAKMDIRWFILVDETDKAYAVASFGFLDTINRSAGVGGIVLPDHRKTGVGKLLHEAICDFGFNVIGLHKLWASVVEDNRRVWEGLKMHGWVVSGFLKDAQFMDGKWHNRVLLERINGTRP